MIGKTGPGTAPARSRQQENPVEFPAVFGENYF
jgi:hypothetical protein